MTSGQLTSWLQTLAAAIKATQSAYPLNKVPGRPIPFFGDVINARVLTIGVNPARAEFISSRKWNEADTIAKWEERLLKYFQHPTIPAHEWFEAWSICLEILRVSYVEGSAAHLDISPRPTLAMIKDSRINPKEFRAMVEDDVKWFFDLVDKLPQVQLLLVAGPIPRANGTKQQLADFIQKESLKYGAKWIPGQPLPKLATPSHPNGIPIFVCPYEPEVDGLYAMVRQVYRNRNLLHRLSAPRLSLRIVTDRHP